ncbi:MAG: c-type cytochrome [Methylibium petroleiphilum]|nr:c-type cytochrome [Methylibium petroleiphilum]
MFIILALVVAAGLSAVATSGAWAQATTTSVTSERPREAVALGRYLVQTAGCNDCHTAGYNEAAGKLAESQWLIGDTLGWRGPWGTTYATNLRLYFANLSEEQWLAHARRMEPRPPMPWFNVRAMSDTDLRAIYRYLKAAGPAGQPAPAYVPPGQTPKGPFVQFP